MTRINTLKMKSSYKILLFCITILFLALLDGGRNQLINNVWAVDADNNSVNNSISNSINDMSIDTNDMSINTNDMSINTTSFKVNIGSSAFRVISGQSLVQIIEVQQKNPENSVILKYTVTTSNDITPYVVLSKYYFELVNSSSQYLNLSILVPENVKQRELFGNIEITNDIDTVVIPIRIEIFPQTNKTFSLDLSVLSKEVFVNKELIYSLYADFYSDQDENAEFTITISHGNKSVKIREFSHKANSSLKMLDKYTIKNDLIKNISLKNNDVAGEYTLKATLEFDGKKEEKIDYFKISQKFYESMTFKITLYILIGLIVLSLLLLIILRYKRSLDEKRRYISPEFKLIPHDDGKDTIFNVGYVADTKVPALMPSYDLVTHVLVAGSTGSGKSVAASIIVEEALNNNIPVVVFDPTAQWTGFLSPLKDSNIFYYYPKFNMSQESSKSYQGMIFTPKDDAFDLNIAEYLNPGEVTIFNLFALTTQQYDSATEKIINKVFSKQWEESNELKLILVFDEVHRLLDPSCQGKGYAALIKACREFRKWGLGLIMVSQVGSDFKEAIEGNVLTEIQLNTKNINDIKKAAKKYGIEYSNRITRQGIGVAMIQNPKYNKGMPWFINFRPPLHNPHKLSQEELTLYTEYEQKLKIIKEKISKLQKKEKEDLELDLKLAIKKLKEGKFKMTDIYIQNLMEKLKI